MQIVIDISEERFRDIQRIAEVQLESNHFKTAEQIIANGTPLPKGHGRMIDANAISICRIRGISEYCRGYNARTTEVENDIKNAPTIIEADKEGDINDSN